MLQEDIITAKTTAFIPTKTSKHLSRVVYRRQSLLIIDGHVFGIVVQVLCNTQWVMDKLVGRPFEEALSDIDQVVQKDGDVRLIESILLGSRFLPLNPHLFQLELLSRFSRAPAANSPVIGRMVAEAATMVVMMSERCIVPLYPCVSSSSAAVRLSAQYRPTHVLAVTTVGRQPEEPHQPMFEKMCGTAQKNVKSHVFGL